MYNIIIAVKRLGLRRYINLCKRRCPPKLRETSHCNKPTRTSTIQAVMVLILLRGAHTVFDHSHTLLDIAHFNLPWNSRTHIQQSALKKNNTSDVHSGSRRLANMLHVTAKAPWTLNWTRLGSQLWCSPTTSQTRVKHSDHSSATRPDDLHWRPMYSSKIWMCLRHEPLKLACFMGPLCTCCIFALMKRARYPCAFPKTLCCRKHL